MSLISEKKQIIVTGSTGMVAQNVIRALVENGNPVVAVSSRPEIAKSRNEDKGDVTYISNDELLNNEAIWEASEGIIHCAFTRNNNEQDVISSVCFAKDVFRKAKESKINSVINISSRSVYIDPLEGELNTEASKVGGGGYIGMGKIMTELMLELLFKGSETRYTSLRIASVNEIKKEEAMRRPMNVFVQKVIANEPIELQGGNQVMSYIDPRDVSSAIMSILSLEGLYKDVYNVGTGWLCTKTLKEIANLVNAIGVNKFALKETSVVIKPSDVSMHSGLSIDRINQDTGWTPKYTLDDMIEQLFELYLF